MIRALEDNSYDIGVIKKEDTAKIEKPKEITETTFIPVVENKKKKDKEEGKKEEIENEAVYVTPTDKDEKNPKKKRKKENCGLLFYF
ncbi:hypothetical protein [Anaerococcus hydrogenalis]|uniref:hypothetical protein n=1 Tax=Anaerococcus hydrogenalis TaxID=33029 RepID=UPI00031E749C|nr:hypothetical protein [Anaerococcus hydrogenalis]